MEFANREYLFLLILLIPYILWYIFWRKGTEPVFRIPDTKGYMGRIKNNGLDFLIHIPFILRLICFTMIVLVLARPQTSNHWKDSQVEGIDIMLAIDISTSMMAEDLKPNRIKAAKNVASKFVSNQPNDNIGLTVFAAEAFTQCPLTTDHKSLLNLFNGVSCDLPAQGLIDDGTAIGMGLANAINRLKKSKAKSKIIILLTDGSNNKGDISPKTAADIAKVNGIRVYTIGVGTNGTALYPYPLPGGGVKYINMPVEIDAQMLREIADKTDGKYYRATNNKELSQIYNDIGQLEKTKIKVRNYSRHYEAFQPFGLIALLSLLLELLLRFTVLKRIP
ncbi:MAG: VWA domain-containing protein [Prevotellaceae bacterium]|nr:VWA domain-containing protein [Candidatus Faecinaster equi]